MTRPRPFRGRGTVLSGCPRRYVASAPACRRGSLALRICRCRSRPPGRPAVIASLAWPLATSQRPAAEGRSPRGGFCGPCAVAAVFPVFPEFIAFPGDFALAMAGAGHRCARVLTRSLRCASGCGLRARPSASPGTAAAVHRATNSGKTAAAITGAAAMPSDNPSTKGSESWNPGSLGEST